MGTELTLVEKREIQIDILKHVAAMCHENNLQYYLVYGTLLGAVRHSGFIPWDDDIDIALPRDDFDRLESVCRLQLPEQYGWVDYKDDFKIANNIAKVCDRQTVLIEESRVNYQVPLGVYIDIFPLDGVPGNYVIRSLHYGRVKLLQMLITLNALDNSRARSLPKKLTIALVQRLMSESSVRSMHISLEKAIRQYEYGASEDACSYLGAYGRKEAFPRAWIGEGTIVEFEGLQLSAFAEYDSYLSRVYGDYGRLPPLEDRKSHHLHKAFRVG